MFSVLLDSTVNSSNHIKCVSLSNQKSNEFKTTFINLHPNEYNQEFQYYYFTVKLDKWVGSCNTLNDLSDKVCVPNKREDLNLSVFNMIVQIQIIYRANVNVNLIEQNIIQISGRKTNVDVSVKNIIHVKKTMFGSLVHVFVKMQNI